MNLVRLAAALLAAFVVTAPAVRAADPYEISVMVGTTGYTAFVGTEQLQALKALEAYVNRTGGIRGRPLSFVVSDDQSNPRVAVQLAQTMIAKHVPLILGPSGPDACAAIMPLLEQNGPLLYCLAPTAKAEPGSYVFMTQVSSDSMLAVDVRYLRERGFHRIAFLASTDAAGQDAERAFDAVLARPENASVQLVSRQHFAPGDLSIAAQMATIKAAGPNAMIAWAAGTPAGTMFRGIHDAGVDVPTVTSAANLNPLFFQQYGQFAPRDLYFNAVPYYGADIVTNPPTKAALATMTRAFAAVGAKPDQIEISAWDPAMIVVDALRKLGTDATAAELRAYLLGLRSFVGVNGPYDFTRFPQRGLGENSTLVVRWDLGRGAADAVSRFGGEPLGAR